MQINPNEQNSEMSNRNVRSLKMVLVHLFANCDMSFVIMAGHRLEIDEDAERERPI